MICLSHSSFDKNLAPSIASVLKIFVVVIPKGWGPANPSLGKTPTIKLCSVGFTDFIPYSLSYQKNDWLDPYRKTHLYLSRKLASWEIQLPGYVKRRNRPFSSFWTNLSGHLIFAGPSLWTFNLSGPIFMVVYRSDTDL